MTSLPKKHRYKNSEEVEQVVSTIKHKQQDKKNEHSLRSGFYEANDSGQTETDFLSELKDKMSQGTCVAGASWSMA